LARNPNLMGTPEDPQYAMAIAALSNKNFAQPPANQSHQPVSSGARDLKF
jgi:carboxyl-terminal processing protease